MANNEDERILSIKVKYQDAIDGILKYQKQVEELKEKQNGLKESFKAGEIGQREYNASMVDVKVQMAEAKEGIRVLEKEARNNLKTQKENEGSLKSLRAELSNSTKAYDEMSKAERDGAKGQELRDHINAVTLQLKEAEAETQRFYRNVGNYEKSVGEALSGLRKQVEEANKKYQDLVKTEGEHAESTKKAKKHLDDLQLSLKFAEDESEKMNGSVLGFVTAGNPWAQTAIKFVQQLGSIKNAFMLAKTGAMMLGKQLLVLMANPIVAFLAIVATAISVLIKGIKGSEENMNRWKVAMAPLGVVLDYISNLITGLASVILTVIEGGGKLLGWISKMCESLPILGSAFEESNRKIQQRVDLQKSQIEYEQKVRAEIVKSAERENTISELRAKVTDKEKYSAKERKAALEEAIRLEREQADEKKKIAELNLKNLELEASLADNDAEMNNKLAEAKAAVIRADTEYNNKIREMNAQRSELNNQIIAGEKAKNDAAKKAAEDAVKIRKERDDKEMEAIRQAEDAMLSLVKDGIEKQRRQILLSYDREIEDLKKKLREEENLTKKAKDAIRQVIKAKELQKAEELQKLSDDEVQKNIEKRKKEIELELEVVKKGSDKEYELKIESLKTQRDMELAQVELTESMKALIKEKYRQKEEELEEKHQQSIRDKQTEAIKKKFDFEYTQLEHEQGMKEKMYELIGASELQQQEMNERHKIEAMNIQYEQKKVLVENMRQEEGESLEEFNNRQLVANQELAEAEIDILLAKKDYSENIWKGMKGAIDSMGESSTAFAKLSKVLALAEIAINTGRALAAGIAAANAVPFPANIGAIATTVATILANIATATKSVNSAKFASGGYVEGPGSGTSDSIPAQLSNGESVMTAAATSMFSPMLSAFNQIGGGVPITVMENNNSAMGEEMLANAVARGMMLAPRPVVSVEEFTTVSHRVEYVDRIGDI